MCVDIHIINLFVSGGLERRNICIVTAALSSSKPRGDRRSHSLYSHSVVLLTFKQKERTMSVGLHCKEDSVHLLSRRPIKTQKLLLCFCTLLTIFHFLCVSCSFYVPVILSSESIRCRILLLTKTVLKLSI